MLVADALRLGGAILGSHPDMLAPQLIGRLLPEIGGNVNVKMLLRACDNDGAKNCALLPVYHCLHTPGGPLKVNGRNWPIKRKIKFPSRPFKLPLNFSVFFGGPSIRCIRILFNVGLSIRRLHIEPIHHLGSEHQRHDQRRKSRYRRNYATFSFEP